MGAWLSRETFVLKMMPLENQQIVFSLRSIKTGEQHAFKNLNDLSQFLSRMSDSESLNDESSDDVRQEPDTSTT
jgi:hypothetical protein